MEMSFSLLYVIDGTARK